jgi:hypothetical protein
MFARFAILSLALLYMTTAASPAPKGTAAPYEPIPFRKQSAPKPKAVKTPGVTAPKKKHAAQHSPAPTVTVPPQL